jgi:HD-GYP domain-containing protein (c-di-GMP phosphodiesterase class II)
LTETIEAAVKHHHERFDGDGYPDRLKGEQIPLPARLLAVADTFDALCSERPYRPAYSTEQALEEMRKVSGSQLDPDLTDAFIQSVADGGNS